MNLRLALLVLLLQALPAHAHKVVSAKECGGMLLRGIEGAQGPYPFRLSDIAANPRYLAHDEGIWNLETGTNLSGKSAKRSSAAVSPDGSLLAIGFDEH